MTSRIPFQDNTQEHHRRNTSISYPPSEHYNGNTPPLNEEDKYPEGRTIKEIYLGIVDPYYDKGYRAREAWGTYTILHQGYTINDEPSPCWVWLGKYRKDNEPIIRMCGSSYFPRALMTKRVGVNGITKPECGNLNCINPKHLKVMPFKGYMKQVRAMRRPQARDEFGRFMPPECES